MITFPRIRNAPLMRAAFCLVVFAVLVSGCGYKGPLYLPAPKEQAAKPAPKPPPAQPAPAAGGA